MIQISGLARWPGVALVSCLAGFGANAAAEDAQQATRDAQNAALERKYGVLEEVVTTARKREEPLQDTPVASTVLSGRILDQRFYADLKTADFPAPNVNITSVGAFNNAVVTTIRGIATSDIDSTFEQSVALFVDGIYLPRPAASSLDMFDLEQVEILRGPQGTLFGRNTTAGAIQLRSRRPTDEFGSMGKLTVGQFGRTDIRAAVNIPISETVKARVAVMSQNSDGYYRNASGRDVGGDDLFSVRPTVVFTPTDRLDITFIGEYHRDDSDSRPQQNQTRTDQILCSLRGQCGFPIGQGDEWKVALEDPGFQDVEVWGLTAEVNYELDSGIVTWLSNFRKTEEAFGYDADGTPELFFQVDREQPHEQYSTELRFASTAWDRFDFITGVFLFHQEYDLKRITTTAIPFPANEVARVSNTGQDHDAYSVYGELNYHVTDDLTVTVGGRYSDEEKDFYQEPFGLVPNAGPRVTQSKSWSDFGPKVGVQYNFTDDVMAYANYQKGFKSGGFNGRCGQPATCARAFDPEEVDGFEVGLKADLLDKRLRANLTLFRNEYVDLQRTTFVPLPADAANPQETVTENAGDATISGIELELTALPFDGLQLDLAVGILDTEYDEYCADVNGFAFYDSEPTSECGIVVQTNNLDDPGGPANYLVEEDNTNEDFARAPELTISFTANYDILLAGGGTINFNGRYTWIDEMTILPRENVTRPDTELLDASITYEEPEGRFRITVFGKNITDELYLQSNTDVPGLFSLRTVNEPRRYGVEFAWDI